jgi:hypothetical protein
MRQREALILFERQSTIMIYINLSVEPRARHVHIADASIDGKHYSASDRRGKKSPVPMLCRKLIDQAGLDRLTLWQVYRGSTPCLRSPLTLDHWAAIDVVDRDEGGIHSKPYVAFDRSTFKVAA